MMRKHVLDILGGVTEEKLLEWANLRVISVPKITSFKDKQLTNSLYLFDIMASIEPRSINKKYIKNGGTPEDNDNNAKYAISVARRIGATTFLVPEDIKEGKASMLMVFVASLAKCAAEYKKEQ